VDVKVNVMNENINIRFAKKSDMKELVLLCQSHASFEKADFLIDNKIDLLEKNLFSSNPSLFCIVVEIDSHLVGYVSYMKQFSTWDACFYIYIDCLYLAEDFRKLGLGKVLIQRVKKEAIKLECNLIQLQTPNFNTNAINFYKAIGGVSKTKERFFINIL
jgi:ribosomal protein S18 acetylase RimI-like enzyme